MEEMRGLVFGLFVWAWLVLIPLGARAESGTLVTSRLSSILTFPTASADHFKSGLLFSAVALESRPWSPWLQADAAWFTLSTVNPGATPNALQPDFKETHSGAEPFQLRTWLKTPLWFGSGARTFVGLTWYYLDLRNAQSANVPNAPTVGVSWRKQLPQDFTADVTAAFAWNPIKNSAYLFLPEATFIRNLGGGFGATASVRLPFSHFSGDQSYTGIAPSILAGIEVRI